ncbi:hypothetical protein Pcinc_016544 [Petrolisthes cinctipes]|uniref:Uncharacterized protein n=1 Tax=Petrolisthes cinctipes TaxID=88211 RepID=A0AAE1KPN8_PETCI|nr:hypothetical protein Pcinc_016544 [Petrolisthes cinctipes]
MVAIHLHNCFQHWVIPLLLTLHGVGQITAVVGVAVFCDVTTQLRYNLHHVKLKQYSKRRIRVSWLTNKEKKLYGNLSFDNLREKTGSLIPKEGEVKDRKSAWFYITCKTFTYLSLAVLLPLTMVGCMVIYAIRTQSSTSKDCQPLMSFSQSLFGAYTLLYIVLFLCRFFKISCSPLCVKRINSSRRNHNNVKLSPEFENISVYPPGWEWACHMWCWVCMGELFLALPTLVIGASYLSFCPHYLHIPVWLMTHGIAVVIYVVVLSPVNRLIKLQPYSSLQPLSNLLTGVFALFIIVWPITGLSWSLAGWQVMATITSSNGGSCDTMFLYYTRVAVAVFILPLLTLIFILFLYLIAIIVVGVGTMLYWCCCDSGIGSDVGSIIKYPYKNFSDQLQTKSNASSTDIPAKPYLRK